MLTKTRYLDDADQNWSDGAAAIVRPRELPNAQGQQLSGVEDASGSASAAPTGTRCRGYLLACSASGGGSTAAPAAPADGARWTSMMLTKMWDSVAPPPRAQGEPQ